MEVIARKTVVITGTSSGIGRATVSRMVQAGWHVFATVRKSEEAERLRSEIGPEVTPLVMDVTDRASINAAAAEAADRLQIRGLTGLVNVAGIGMVRPVEYVTDNDLREIFEINVFGQIAVTQAFLPLLRKAPGRIVNISSIGAHLAIPFGGLLNASKSAFGLFSDTLRLELRPFGIRVSAVEPGAIRTPAVDKTLGHMDEVVQQLPAMGVSQYGKMLKGFARRAYSREMNGSSPDVVANAVVHALTSSHPHTRYVVGKHASLLAAMSKILPEWLLDAVLLRIAGLPTKLGALATAGR